jgi:hypothetical protein
VAEVEVQEDGAGRITNTSWKTGSGDERWDASVRKAIASTPSVNRPPPTGFPGRCLVRFDVLAATEPLLPQAARLWGAKWLGRPPEWQRGQPARLVGIVPIGRVAGKGTLPGVTF